MNYIGLLKEFLNLEPLEQLPEESTITQDQYNQLLELWISTQGPNTGKGLFGEWAWQAGKENHFKTELHNLGVSVENIQPDQQSSAT